MSDALFRDEIAVDEAHMPLSLRLWRPPSRVALAAWSGAVGGAICAFALGLPPAAAWACAIAIGVAVFAWPLSSTRRAPIVLTVDRQALRIEQGSRAMVVPLASVRAARVVADAGVRRQVHGFGLSWGHTGRRVWDLPAPGVGLVRIERDHRGLDLDVATSAPRALVDAVYAPRRVSSGT